MFTNDAAFAVQFFPLIAREFPTFDQDTLPEIPTGFRCSAWHNDGMPIWFEQTDSEAGRIMLAVDFPDRENREFPDGHRFSIHVCNSDCSPTDLHSSDNWVEILSIIDFIRYVRDLGIGFHPDTRDRDYEDGDGNPVFSLDEAEKYDENIDEMFRCVDDIYDLSMKIWQAMGILL